MRSPRWNGWCGGVRDLHPLLLNFVNFQQFYARKSPAIFQVGTLYLDQRAAELVFVSMMWPNMPPWLRCPVPFWCIVIVCVKRREKMTIAAAFTNGIRTTSCWEETEYFMTVMARIGMRPSQNWWTVRSPCAKHSGALTRSWFVPLRTRSTKSAPRLRGRLRRQVVECRNGGGKLRHHREGRAGCPKENGCWWWPL